MVGVPGFLMGATRFLGRGGIYLLPPIRFNMPVNVNNNQDRKQLFKVGSRVFNPERIVQVSVFQEYKWPGLETWTTYTPDDDEQIERMNEKHGPPEKRIFGANIILDDGEVIWLDRRKYWKFYGVLMQIGTEI